MIERRLARSVRQSYGIRRGGIARSVARQWSQVGCPGPAPRAARSAAVLASIHCSSRHGAASLGGSRGEILSALELKDCSVSFAPGDTGDWEPAALAKLGSGLAEWGRFNLSEPPVSTALDQKEAKPSPRVQADFWDRINLSIEKGDMSWWNIDKRELASAAGIWFNITPLSLPNRKMTHYFLTLENAKIGDQRSVRNFTFEMLKMDSNNIVLTCVGDWGPEGGDEARATSK